MKVGFSSNQKVESGFTLIRTIRKNLIIAQQGFTLIELLVVILIIGILIGLSIFGLQGARRSARDAQRKTDLEEIRSGLEIYKADCGTYPTNDVTAESSLVGGTGCDPQGSTYISSIPTDPDPSQSYSYTSGGSTYTLCATLEQSSTSWCVNNP